MTDPRIEAAVSEWMRQIDKISLEKTGRPAKWTDPEILSGIRNAMTAALASADAAAWRPISEAPKDRTPILAKTRPDICPESSNRSGWNGRHVVIQHDGILDDGFDMGWSIAAPVGYGGMPDEWFLGWQPLPAPPVVDVGGDDE